MSARVSEAIVLRTYPLQESDLIVSFLTRDQGKLRGVAKRARRPKSRFGSGLERLSQVRMFYLQKETRELVTLDSCELIQSQFGLLTDYTASVALDYVAEVCEQLLPAAEPNEKYYRLVVAVLDHFQKAAQSGLWRGTLYFSLWSVRLAGFLPALEACQRCGTWLDDPENPERCYFTRSEDGLLCSHCRPSGAWELSGESRMIARDMLKNPVGQIGPSAWSRETAADLRRFLVQRIENAIDRKLVTVPVLEQC
ncbi:MAG: DNA repair protein RecO [Bryobacteraceae bacterium]